MKELILSASTEICNNQVFLAIHISDTKLLEQEEKNLFLYLRQLCGSVSEKCLVKACHSLEAIQKLISSKKWKHNGRAPFFNPFGTSSAHIEAEVIGPDAILSGILTLNGEKHPFSSIEFLFPGSPIWGICKQMIFVLPPEISMRDLQEVYPSEKILFGAEKELFMHKKRSSELEIIWKGDKPESKALPVFPILRLTDRQGAFASLWMQYADTLLSFEDKTPFPGRNFSDEKTWEKDLLETGFQRKNLGSSQYYCPMDQVSKTLSFLLELGWEIRDYHQKRLIKMTGSTLSIAEKGKNFLIKGSLQYGSYQASMENITGAFSRKERFIDLSTDSTGWLSDEEITEWNILAETEITKEGFLLKKHNIGLLEGLSLEKMLPPSLLDRARKARSTEGEKDPLFQGELYPYQQEGKEWLCFLHANGFSGLLADEMGLGKTIQTLSFLSTLHSDKPILLIAPTSLIFNWKREWERFLPHKKLHIHQGSDRSTFDILKKQEAILTSHAILRIDQALFCALSYSAIIFDEAQAIKNSESQLAKVSYLLQADMRLCLTGTPVENRAEDLWSLFHFLEPELLGTKKNFTSELSASEVDVRYKNRMQKKIRPFILRRRKEEVLQDLPEKLEECVYVAMDLKQKAFYEEYLRKTRQGLLKKVTLEKSASHKMEILEAILRLRQICCDPLLIGEASIGSAKTDRIFLDLEEIVESKRKVLVYSQFTKLLQIIETGVQKRNWSYTYLDGSTKDRESAISSFQQESAVSIFLISLKAGGVGLNLTAADYVLLLDPWWNEAVEAQAIDRAHRLGRKDPVVARRYIAAESIEEKIMTLKSHKRSLASQLLDPSLQDLSLEMSDLIALLDAENAELE
jgi:SNF2 family DNA or RNA helicase